MAQKKSNRFLGTEIHLWAMLSAMHRYMQIQCAKSDPCLDGNRKRIPFPKIGILDLFTVVFMFPIQMKLYHHDQAIYDPILLNLLQFVRKKLELCVGSFAKRNLF
jgi:hypothetical protein